MNNRNPLLVLSLVCFAIATLLAAFLFLCSGWQIIPVPPAPVTPVTLTPTDEPTITQVVTTTPTDTTIPTNTPTLTATHTPEPPTLTPTHTVSPTPTTSPTPISGTMPTTGMDVGNSFVNLMFVGVFLLGLGIGAVLSSISHAEYARYARRTRRKSLVVLAHLRRGYRKFGAVIAKHESRGV